MSLRVGIDVLSIESIRKAVERRGEYFLRRAFTSREIKECFSSSNPYPCLAGKFAAKEAVYKALQGGFNLGLIWREIEIVTEDSRPNVKLNGRTAEGSTRNGVGSISISITHDLKSGTAVAVALAEHSRR
ncbi:MAG: holo-ACP synthase [Thermoproteota archaeon]